MKNRSSRRDFLKTTAFASAALAAASSIPRVHAGEDNTLKIALVGCGGRGRGAAAQALNADPNTKLVAVCDAFRDRAVIGLNKIREDFAARVDVPDERIFDGLEGYKAAIDSCDVVLLCEPTHFRPLTLRYAVDAGKHIFCEKPVAVDAPGVRKFLEAAQDAKRKNLNLVGGLCWRYDTNVREIMKRIQDGEIGDVVTARGQYLTAPVWSRPRAEGDTEMMAQVRNWVNFYWLSGEFNVEQHVHTLDKGLWAFGEKLPVSAFGIGGRMQKVDQPQWGDCYDAMSVVYEYEDGRTFYSLARQQKLCWNNNDLYVAGTKGHVTVLRPQINGKKIFQTACDKYQLEHNALFGAIRSGGQTYINDGEIMANSTQLGILGRDACYTGKRITWEEAAASEVAYAPTGYTWDSNPPTLPDDNGRYKIQVPGLGEVYHQVTR